MEIVVANSLWSFAGLIFFAGLTYICDVATLRFLADPDPRRANAVRVLGLLSTIGILGLYAAVISFFATTIILADTALYSVTGGPKKHARLIASMGVLSGFVVAPFVRAWIRSTADLQKFVQIERILPPNAGASQPWFMGMQYYALILNRTYKVFVTDTMLCGAKVVGLVASPPSPRKDQLSSDGWAETLASTLYERLNVTSAEFLRMNFANFQIAWREIDRIDFSVSPKWGMGNVPYSGRIFLRLKSGRSKELILVGEQDGPAIRDKLDETRLRNNLL